MRENKFRAWNKLEKTMGKPFTLQQAIRARPQIDPTEDCIYLEFTGLLDKEGKEIYEGDIVKYCHTPDERYKPMVAEVKFDEYESCFNLVGWFDHFGHKGIRQTFNWEIIGNIYENPELLEAK